VSVVAVWTSITRVHAFQAIAVTRTITIDRHTHETFAPPGSALPATTSTQAYAEWERDTGASQTTIPRDTTVHLGLLTLPVGPYCGAECHGLTVRNGIAYSALNQLAYGYSWPAFPHRYSHRMNWIFLDASTGQMIVGFLQQRQGGPQ
jgi:hypothetical protein